MKTEEEILEMHLGSDFYLVKENGMLKHIIAAMREYASQFKTVEPEKRAELLKEIMDTDQEHGMYETEKENKSKFMNFHRWLVDNGWHEHSSKEYFYRSKDFHQWPPDQTATENELLEMFMTTPTTLTT